MQRFCPAHALEDQLPLQKLIANRPGTSTFDQVVVFRRGLPVSRITHCTGSRKRSGVIEHEIGNRRKLGAATGINRIRKRSLYSKRGIGLVDVMQDEIRLAVEKALP